MLLLRPHCSLHRGLVGEDFFYVFNGVLWQSYTQPHMDGCLEFLIGILRVWWSCSVNVSADPFGFGLAARDDMMLINLAIFHALGQ